MNEPESAVIQDQQSSEPPPAVANALQDPRVLAGLQHVRDRIVRADVERQIAALVIARLIPLIKPAIRQSIERGEPLVAEGAALDMLAAVVDWADVRASADCPAAVDR